MAQVGGRVAGTFLAALLLISFSSSCRAANDAGLRLFLGLENGAGGPVYFGLEGAAAGESLGLEYSLAGRLRLGNAVVARGQAWLGVRPEDWLRLRGGYGDWLDEDRSGWGVRADAAFGGLTLHAAYLYQGSPALGAGWREDNWRLRFWLRDDGWLTSGGLRAGPWSLRAWVRADYRLQLRDYALAAAWESAPWRVAFAGSGAWGYSLALDWSGPWRLGLEGRWNPGRSLLAVAKAFAPLGEGNAISGELSYAIEPFAEWRARLELQTNVYSSPGQGE